MNTPQQNKTKQKTLHYRRSATLLEVTLTQNLPGGAVVGDVDEAGLADGFHLHFRRLYSRVQQWCVHSRVQ